MDNTIEKLKDEITSINRERPTIDDVVRMFSLALEAIEKVKNDMDVQLEDQDKSTKEKLASTDAAITDVKGIVDTLTESMTDYVKASEIDNNFGELRNDIQRIEALIPSLENLENSVKELQSKWPSINRLREELRAEIPVIPEFPVIDLEPLRKDIDLLKIRTEEGIKEIGAEEIKEKLESLKGDERLDASAVKNLPKPGTSGMAYPQAGQNIAVSGRTVSLNIPIQATAPSNPKTNDLWIDSS